MDCRKGLWLALGLWGGAVGCQHTGPVAVATVPPDAVVTPKTADGPKKLPRPETCVAFADCRAVEACAANYSPSQREQLRDDARKAYQDALSLDPKCLAAQRGLARLYLSSEDYPRAIAAYEKALKTAPKNASLWYELGMCHHRREDWQAALDALAHATELEPDNRTYVNTQAVLLARLGRHQESLQCFSRVTSEAQAHFNLACTLRRLNQPDESRRHLELALQTNPRLESARALLNEMTAPPIHPVGYTEPQPPTAAESPPSAATPAEQASVGLPQGNMNLAPPSPPSDGALPSKEE